MFLSQIRGNVKMCAFAMPTLARTHTSAQKENQDMTTSILKQKTQHILSVKVVGILSEPAVSIDSFSVAFSVSLDTTEDLVFRSEALSELFPGQRSTSK